jgi:spermidine synthase
MGGLALGAWVAGKRRAGTLRSYVVLELIVAVSALLLPIALGATVPALAWAYADGSAPAQFAVVRVVISLALLGVPAAAMGATFPIAADWYARNAADAGALYAVNTAGAAAGAIAAGFFLIPAVGLRATTGVGVLLNLIAASGAWWLASRSRSDETAERAKTAEVSFSKSSKSKKHKPASAPSLRSPRSPRFLLYVRARNTSSRSPVAAPRAEACDASWSNVPSPRIVPPLSRMKRSHTRAASLI